MKNANFISDHFLIIFGQHHTFPNRYSLQFRGNKDGVSEREREKTHTDTQTHENITNTLWLQRIHECKIQMWVHTVLVKKGSLRISHHISKTSTNTGEEKGEEERRGEEKVEKEEG